MILVPKLTKRNAAGYGYCRTILLLLWTLTTTIILVRLLPTEPNQQFLDSPRRNDLQGHEDADMGRLMNKLSKNSPSHNHLGSVRPVDIKKSPLLSHSSNRTASSAQLLQKFQPPKQQVHDKASQVWNW